MLSFQELLQMHECCVIPLIHFVGAVASCYTGPAVLELLKEHQRFVL